MDTIKTTALIAYFICNFFMFSVLIYHDILNIVRLLIHNKNLTYCIRHKIMIFNTYFICNKQSCIHTICHMCVLFWLGNN